MQPKHFFYINILRAKIRAKKAYSLLELSVVITIMSILMMGVASIVNNSMKKAQKNETQERMQIIYNAMGKFLLRQARFPQHQRTIQDKILFQDYRDRIALRNTWL